MNKKRLIKINLVILMLLAMVFNVNAESYTNNSIQIKNETAIEELLKKANNSSITNYEDGNKEELYTFSQPKTDQTEALTDYRYIGNIPKNYVKFNNETWRIIGVFNVDGENKLKIVRDNFLDQTHEYSDKTKNDWTISNLNEYLNQEYKEAMDDDSKKMIQESTYYLGGIWGAGWLEFQEEMGAGTSITDEKFYRHERSNTVSNDNATNTKNYFALLYPSDIIYTYSYNVGTVEGGFSNPVNNSWLFKDGDYDEWLLTHQNNHNFQSFTYIHSQGRLINQIISFKGNIRPVVYLNSNVLISGGEGTTSNPYILKLADNKSISATNTENGKVDIINDGENVKIEVTPDEGYEVKKVEALDEENKEIKLTKNDEYTYTFKYEEKYGNIKVNAEFQKKSVVSNLINNPQTYDSLIIWVAIFGISIIAIVCVLIFKKRKKKKFL